MLRPRALDLLTAALLAAALPAAHAAERTEAAGPGISYALPLAPQWQARLGWSAPSAPLHRDREGGAPSNVGLSLFGDYYIPHGFGLRATGGVMLGAERRGPTLWPALGSRPAFPRGAALAAWQDEPGAQDKEPGFGAAPYLGLGYTGLAARGTLGLFADLGVRGLKPRSSVQLGGAAGWREADPEIWRPWREWRFEPVLQLGVSYTF